MGGTEGWRREGASERVSDGGRKRASERSRGRPRAAAAAASSAEGSRRGPRARESGPVVTGALAARLNFEAGPGSRATPGGRRGCGGQGRRGAAGGPLASGSGLDNKLRHDPAEGLEASFSGPVPPPPRRPARAPTSRVRSEQVPRDAGPATRESKRRARRPRGGPGRRWRRQVR